MSPGHLRGSLSQAVGFSTFWGKSDMQCSWLLAKAIDSNPPRAILRVTGWLQSSWSLGSVFFPSPLWLLVSVVAPWGLPKYFLCNWKLQSFFSVTFLAFFWFLNISSFRRQGGKQGVGHVEASSGKIDLMKGFYHVWHSEVSTESSAVTETLVKFYSWNRP